MSTRNRFSECAALTGVVVFILPFLVSVSHADQKPARDKEQQVQIRSKTLAASREPANTQTVDCSIQSHPDCQTGTTEHFFTVEIAE